MKNIVLRVARPTDRLTEISEMYRLGLDLDILAGFKDHQGFDGVILGHPDSPYHLEFTHKAGHAAGVSPSEDNLLVFYLPEKAQWESQCKKMRKAGFKQVPSFNPYWDNQGQTFEDPDGYRVVLQNGAWGSGLR